MSGHSKWSTIKRSKGAKDAKRGQTFTKLSNAITLAAKSSGGDPDQNPKLRLAIEMARDVNMPKDNIQRAIDKGLGNLPGQIIEEVVYEGFGPGRVAFFVEGATDNKLRTSQEIRMMFERSGGALAGQGSVGYMFDKKGEIRVQGIGDSEEVMLKLIDLGAEDVDEYDEDGVKKYLVYTEPTQLALVAKQISDAGFKVESKDLVHQPNVTADLTDKEVAEKVIGLAEKLEDHDDIQKVYANFNLSNEVSEQLGF